MNGYDTRNLYRKRKDCLGEYDGSHAYSAWQLQKVTKGWTERPCNPAMDRLTNITPPYMCVDASYHI